MSAKLDLAEEERKKDVQELTNKNATLVNENKNLRTDIANLTKQVSDLKWQSFRRPGEPSPVLIGDGLLRDTCEQKLHDTKVVFKPGAKVADAIQEVRSWNGCYTNMTVMVGGNACAEDDGGQVVRDTDR